MGDGDLSGQRGVVGDEPPVDLDAAAITELLHRGEHGGGHRLAADAGRPYLLDRLGDQRLHVEAVRWRPAEQETGGRAELPVRGSNPGGLARINDRGGY